VLVAYRLLLELGFDAARSGFGALALLFGSSFLGYSQHHQENGLQFLMTASAAFLFLRWVATDAPGPLVLGALCLGYNLLIRVTTVLDIGFVTLVVVGQMLLTARGRVEPRSEVARRLIRLAAVSALVYGAALALDRLYHYERF